MKIYFARHGRTNYNDLSLCNADPSVDVHLTEGGVKQAEALAEKMKDISIDHIYASELKRTQQTAEIVNKYHNLTLEIDKRLGDHKSGFEGKHFLELKQALDDAEDRWTARFNGGESIEDMKVRVDAFLDELKTKPYESVLVVTSGWVVQAAAAMLNNLSNEEAWNLEVAQGDFLVFEV